MALTTTLALLRTEVRRRADMENSTFVSDAEVNSYINYSYAELYDLLIKAYGENYSLTSTTITTTSNTTTYNLPSDFYKLVGAELLISGSSVSDIGAEFVTLTPYNWAERNNYSGVNTGFSGSQKNYKYQLIGSTIKFIKPEVGKTIQIWYHPAITKLSADSDTLDGVNGWEEYITIDAAIKCLVKEESDTNVLELMKQQMLKRIEEMAAQRDVGSSERVSDVTTYSSVTGFEDY